MGVEIPHGKTILGVRDRPDNSKVYGPESVSCAKTADSIMPSADSFLRQILLNSAVPFAKFHGSPWKILGIPWLAAAAHFRVHCANFDPVIYRHGEVMLSWFCVCVCGVCRRLSDVVQDYIHGEVLPKIGHVAAMFPRNFTEFRPWKHGNMEILRKQPNSVTQLEIPRPAENCHGPY